MVKHIPLTQGELAIVDDEDYEFINQWNWQYNNGYACRQQRNKGTRKKIYMHRVLSDSKEGEVTDHINFDKLDNRKSNLRKTDYKGNRVNTKSIGGTSLFKGVRHRSSNHGFSAQITNDGKQLELGTYEKEEDAALAYNRKAIELFGKLAHLNDIYDDGRELKTTLENKKTSKYTGVYFNKRNNKFTAKTSINRKTKHIGYFDSELEAAKAYDDYIIKHKLNRKINFKGD